MTTWWENLFAGFNTTGEVEVTCAIDEEEVDCRVFQLEEKGFHYNKEENWWERTWTVATKTGCERSKEVYKQDDEGWVTLMYGNDNELFYEQRA
tara:strand:+ start:427 stop:708 length:282 start_codon:yes stop_codon:yes gene_type:complete